MFAWYQNAEVCYVYLSDVHSDEVRAAEGTDPAKGTRLRSLFRSCKWFSRGWTLQELLAPKHVKFFSQDWVLFGDKFSLAPSLTACSGIPWEALWGKPLHCFNVAERMRWAAYRKTTRTEDLAYCLMGIFDVHMPLLYGEGNHAFFRLQEQIINKTEDASIFAWSTAKYLGGESDLSFLAHAPYDFGRHGLTHSWKYDQLSARPKFPRLWMKRKNLPITNITPPVVTARGLQMHIPLCQIPGVSSLGLITVINASSIGDQSWLCVPLIESATTPGTFFRRPLQLLVRRFSKDDRVFIRQIYLAINGEPSRGHISTTVAWRHETLNALVRGIMDAESFSSVVPSELSERLREEAWCISCRFSSPNRESFNADHLCSLWPFEVPSPATNPTYPATRTFRFTELSHNGDDSGVLSVLKLETVIRRLFKSLPTTQKKLAVCCLVAFIKVSRALGIDTPGSQEFPEALISLLSAYDTVAQVALRMEHYFNKHTFGHPGVDLLVFEMLQISKYFPANGDQDVFAQKIAEASFRSRMEWQNSAWKSSIAVVPGDCNGLGALDGFENPASIIVALSAALHECPTPGDMDTFVHWLESLRAHWSHRVRAEDAHLLFEAVPRLCQFAKTCTDLSEEPEIMHIACLLRLQSRSEVPDNSDYDFNTTCDRLTRRANTASEKWRPIIEVVIQDTKDKREFHDIDITSRSADSMDDHDSMDTSSDHVLDQAQEPQQAPSQGTSDAKHAYKQRLLTNYFRLRSSLPTARFRSPSA